MYYIDVLGFLEHPEKDWEAALEEDTSSPLPRHRTTGGLDMVLVSGFADYKASSERGFMFI